MMKTNFQQRGVTFGGFIMVLVLLVVAAIITMKLIPPYMENGKVQKAFESIVRDPEMSNATIADIRDSFYKRAITMDNVTTVSAADIDIYKEGTNLTLSANYSAKIPLAGNVSLLIEFTPSASK
ncbi:MAG: DUF4845 domain-containing protein [Gallionellaceae bacterium]|jgi:hypothetical protein